jgi:hypothetical protein
MTILIRPTPDQADADNSARRDSRDARIPAIESAPTARRSGGSAIAATTSTASATAAGSPNASCGSSDMWDRNLPTVDRNATRWILLDEAARSLYGESWPKVGSEVVGTLRMDAARYPDDPRTAELVGELSMKSEHFRRWWADQKVVEWTHDVKVLHHPIAGVLTLATEAVTFPGDPDQIMFTLLATPGSPTSQALTMLSAWLQQEAPAG